MRNLYIYKYDITLIDSTNLIPMKWTLTKHILAKNREESENKLKNFYSYCQIIDIKFIEIIQVIY